MEVQIAVLCDAATDNTGKLNLLGAFDTIVSNQLPVVHPQCSVALRVVFHSMEAGKHKVRLNFVDEDGKTIMPHIEIPTDIRMADEMSFLSRNFIVNIQQLKFKRAGLFSIEVTIDDRHSASIPLQVHHRTNPPK
ncbi:MAG TPA: hypothetical protein EYQ50_23870 [Verrucomicrobiales bacterium]|jgi:hypothetical protein|nr:hypothetical protein [Verrucomicrobiales bacterium]HIL68970.1 hypothetical protein [Verrucomicrobiota bacterium]